MIFSQYLSVVQTSFHASSFLVSVLHCTEEQLVILIPTSIPTCVCFCAGVGSTVWHTHFLAVKWCCGCRLWDWPVTRGRHCSTAPVCWKAGSFTTSLMTTVSKMTICIIVSQRAVQSIPEARWTSYPQKTNAGSGFSLLHTTLTWDLEWFILGLMCLTLDVNWFVYRKKKMDTINHMLLWGVNYMYTSYTYVGL